MVKCAVNKVKFVLKKIDIRNLTELNNIMYADVAYVFELVGANKLPKTKKEPWWKRRLEGKLKDLIEIWTCEHFAWEKKYQEET